MIRSKVSLPVSIALFVVASTPALAQDRGTLEQSKACEKESHDSRSWGDLQTWPYPLSVKMKAGAVSAACKSELDRRIKSCVTKSSMQNLLKDLSQKSPGMTIEDLCNTRAFLDINDAIANADRKEADAKKLADEKAAEEAKHKEETAKVELPKAKKKDPALEKAVAAAYDRDYPGNKVLKVILGEWSTDYEKDSFGKVTGRDLDATVVNKHPDGTCELHNEYWMQHGNGKKFSGPLSARGAGSMTKTEILCSKVEGKK